MQESIHGHEVLQMMLASGRPYTRESLRTEIMAKFGADARFHTCSADNLSADGLIDFLDQRGKFTGDDAGFNTEPTRICSDG